MFDKLTWTVGTVEEICIPRDACVDALIIEFLRQLGAGNSVILLESEAQWIDGFHFSVDLVDEILSPNVLANWITVEFCDKRDHLTRLVHGAVVYDNDTITTPQFFIVGLKQFQTFIIKSLFILNILSERL